MAMNAGDPACTLGLAQVIYSYLAGDPACGFSSPLGEGQDAALKALAYNLSLATVTYVQTHAEVSVTVRAGSLGAGIPASDVTLSGGIT